MITSSAVSDGDSIPRFIAPLDSRTEKGNDFNPMAVSIDDIRSMGDEEEEREGASVFGSYDSISSNLKCLNRLNCCGLEDNVFVLVCLFIGTTTFTIAQFLGAIAANSLAMYGDCATMALDSLTYLLNIYCEKNRIAGMNEAIKLEIIVASISVAALTFVTVFLLWDSLQRLRTQHPATEEVQADIMLEFGIANFFIDLLSCSLFISKLKEAKLTRNSNSNPLQLPRGRYEQIPLNSLETDPSVNDTKGLIDDEMEEDVSVTIPTSASDFAYDTEKDSRKQKSRMKIEINEDLDIEIVQRSGPVTDISDHPNLNMASAFLHLAADTLRTITVLITALVVDIDSQNVDSVDVSISFLCLLTDDFGYRQMRSGRLLCASLSLPL